MEIHFKKPSVRIDDILILFFFIAPFILLIFMFIDLNIRKPNVVVDENYKGKYIKVLHYELLNRDSTYQYYYQPKEVTVKVLSVDRDCSILIQDGRYKELVPSFRLEKKYKVGQNIKLEKTFYPKVRYSDIYYKGKYNKK